MNLFFRVTNIDHNGYLGREPHPASGDVGRIGRLCRVTYDMDVTRPDRLVDMSAVLPEPGAGLPDTAVETQLFELEFVNGQRMIFASYEIEFAGFTGEDCCKDCGWPHDAHVLPGNTPDTCGRSLLD